jgi:hypothetical protein
MSRLTASGTAFLSWPTQPPKRVVMYRIVFNILIIKYFKPLTRALPVASPSFWRLNLNFGGFGTTEFVAEKGGQRRGQTRYGL